MSIIPFVFVLAALQQAGTQSRHEETIVARADEKRRQAALQSASRKKR